ncbi:MAG: DUF975 family protein [Bacillota bacterium]
MINEFLAKDYRRIARDKLHGNWPGAVLAGLLAILLGGAGATIQISFSKKDWPWSGFVWPWPGEVWQFHYVFTAVAGIGIAIWLARLIIGSAVHLGWCSFNMRLVRDAQASVSELFERFSIIGKAVGLRLFMGLFIFLWSLLLIVPGIVAAYRYSQAAYLMAENPGMGIREAVDASKRMMAGRKGRLFCLHLSFVGWWILSILTFGVGLLFLIPYVKAAETAFYFTASGRAIPKQA